MDYITYSYTKQNLHFMPPRVADSNKGTYGRVLCVCGSVGMAGAAAFAAFSGQSGMMVALKRLSDDPYQCVTELHDIHDVANYEKTVPQHWIDAKNARMNKEFLTYARPLIQSEVSPLYVGGLPQHIRL